MQQSASSLEVLVLLVADRTHSQCKSTGTAIKRHLGENFLPTILEQGEEPGKEEPIVVASIIEVSCEARARNELVYDLDKIDGHEFEDAMAEVFRVNGIPHRARKAFK